MNNIVREIKHHVPFTAFGAVLGIILMIVFNDMPHETAHRVFYVFHPLHVFLSAMVTSAMYKIHRYMKRGEKSRFVPVFVIGYTGSLAIATLSDSLIPYAGEFMMKLPNLEAHIGFIEEWWLVNPAAFLGIVTGYFLTKTEFPHAGHVLLSTWASLFHIIMAAGGCLPVYKYAGVFFFLFVSVWIPCCVSDIVFPLFFIKDKR